MSVKFNPYLPMTMTGAQATSASALPGRAMAPLSLTPLPAPARGVPVVRVAVSQEPAPALDYSAFFAAHRDTLLAQLRLADTTPANIPSAALSSTQRSACVGLLTALAAAADASRSE